MVFSFLFKMIPTQVILTCRRQTDCLFGKYCSSHNLCYSCSYVTEDTCDSLTGCCSVDYLKQCPDSLYPCHSINTETSNNTLHSFLIIFCVSSLSYVSVGSYWNKYVNNRKGYDIFPHKQKWLDLFGLVKDGINYSFKRTRYCIHNNYERIHDIRYE